MKSLKALFFLLAAAACAPRAQVTQAQRDSGWAPLFDGSDFAGLYVYTKAGGVRDTVVSGDASHAFSARGGIIHCEGSPAGYLGTKAFYSHYRVRVQARFLVDGSPSQNAGLMYHIREKERRYKETGDWPRCVEMQGQKRGMGEIWTISNVMADITIDTAYPGRRYKEGGRRYFLGYPEDERRQCEGSSNPYVDGQWNEMEAVVRGADSVRHSVNGVTVIRATLLRVSDQGIPTDFQERLNDGAIALQSEGAPIEYRNWMIMELDSATGAPLHAKAGEAALSRSPAGPPRWRASLDRGRLTVTHPAGSPERLTIATLQGRILGALDLSGPSQPMRAAGPLLLRGTSGSMLVRD